MKSIRHRSQRLVLPLLAGLILASSTWAGEAKKPYILGGFVFKQAEDGSWDSGAPQCVGDEALSKIADVTPVGNDASHLLVKLEKIKVPWQLTNAQGAPQSTKIGLISRINGADVELTIKGFGTLSATPGLSLYKDAAAVKDLEVSFINGKAPDAVPAAEGAKIVGLCHATAKVAVKVDDTHPLLFLSGWETELSIATIEYIEKDADKDKTITTVAGLRSAVTVHTITYMSLNIHLEDNLTRVLECRHVDSAPPEYVDGKTAQITFGDATIKAQSLATPAMGSLMTFSLPVHELNNIVDLGLKEDLLCAAWPAPGGTVLVAELTGGFAVDVPGLGEKLQFGRSRFTFILGSKANGSKPSVGVETTLVNPGVLFGPLGDNIGANKKVSLEIGKDLLAVNFHNSLEDLKPLGFSLRQPTVAIDFGRKAVNLSGNIAVPDNFPIPLANKDAGIDVAGEIGKQGVRFTLISAMEVSIFDDAFRLGINTLEMGVFNKKAYFAGVGTARLTQEISLFEGLDVIKDKGFDIKVGTELTARLFIQSDGEFYVGLETGKLIALEAGPVKSDLKNIKLILRRSAATGKWVASLEGTTSVAIDAGPMKLNVTTRAMVASDGRLVIEIPQDPENPTGMAIGDVAAITIDHGKLEVNLKRKPNVTVDATVSLTLAKEVPVIGGQPISGHMAMDSDGNFVFEAVNIPQITWQGMEFGLTDLYVRNEMKNGQPQLSAGIGGGLQFLDDFALQPLRGNRVGMSATISSNPFRIKLAIEGPWRFTIPHPEGGNTDFTFVFNELAISFGQGGIKASGTGGVEIKYPTSKYFLVGLPAALAGKDVGPDFKLGVTISVAQNYIYFSTAEDWDPPEIPIDVPGVVEGLTLQINSLGGGIMWMANPPYVWPLGDISARVCMPNLNGASDFTTPTLHRPYHSHIGFMLGMTMEKPFVAAFDISKENPPSIKIGDVVDVDMREAALSTWLNATSVDVAGKVRFGHPEKGLGFLIDLLPPEGKSDNFHLCFFPAGPIMIPVPFHQRMDIHTNLAGFETRLTSEFPRPAIGPADMLSYMPLMFKIVKTGDFDLFLDELQNPVPGTDRKGKLYDIIPRYKLENAFLVFPSPLNDVFTALPKTKDGRRRLTLFPKIDIDPTRAIPPLMQAWDVIRDPKTLPSKLVQFVPKDKRIGDFHVRFLGLVEGDLAYELSVAGIKYEQEPVTNLKALLDTVDVTEEVRPQIPALDQNPLVVKLKDGRSVNVSGTRIVDLPTEAGKVIKCIDAKALPDNVRKSPRAMLVQLYKNSAAGASRGRIRGNRIDFARTTGASKLDSYQIDVELTRPYGIPMDNGAAVGPHTGLPGGGIGGGARLPTAFPTSVRKRASYRTGWQRRYTDLDFIGQYQANANGGLRLLLRHRHPARTFYRYWWWYRYNPPQNVFLDHNRQRRSQLAYNIIDAKGWRGDSVLLKDFNLDMTVSDATRVSVSKWGTATADIARGQVVLRTTLKNSPASEARKLCDLIETLDLGSVLDVDRSMARAWKRLWEGRAGGPQNRRTQVVLPLKAGATLYVHVPHVAQRYRYVQWYRAYLYSYRKKVWFWYQNIPVFGWRWRYNHGAAQVNIVQATGNGDLQVLYSPSSAHNGWQTLFSPRRYPSPKQIKKLEDMQGVVTASKGSQHAGLIPNADDNRYGFTITRKSGWSARTDGKDVWITSPERRTVKFPCDGQLSARLAGFGLSGEARDGYVFGSPGTYMVRSANGAGTAKTKEAIVTVAGGDKLAMPRDLTWPNGKATLHSDGCVTGVHGLQSRGPAISTTTLRGEKTGRPYLIKVARGVPQAEYEKDGSKVSVRIIKRGDSRGVVEYPVSNNEADGLIVDGRLALGLKQAIRGETAFHGEIYSNGKFDLKGSAKIWVLSHELAQGKVRLSSQDGFFVQGKLNAPLIHADMTGTIQRNYFCFSGHFDTRVKGTGLVGEALLDSKGFNAQGELHLLGKMLSRGKIVVRSGQVEASFGARTGGSFTIGGWPAKVKIRWAVGYNVQVILREGGSGRLPTATLNVCLWIDAPWPVGYRSLRFTLRTPERLEFKQKIGPATITINLSNFSIRASV